MRRLSMPQPQAIDDATGFKVDHRRLRRQWDGAMVVDPDKRNPQDFLRARPERQAIPNPRPELPDTFLALNIIFEDGISPVMREDGAPVFDESGVLGGQGL